MCTWNTGGTVSLLHVIEPPEFQQWAAVGDVTDAERREEAGQLLDDLSLEVNEWAGLRPELMVREGDVGKEILTQVREDSAIDVLVVGAAPPGDRRFSLITFLAEKLLGYLTVPLVVVPGNLSDRQIANMT